MASQVYSISFDPILLPNETATLFGPDFPDGGQPVTCRAVGALPEYQKDFSSLTAVTWSRDNEDANLEMPDLHLAQIRMRILDDFKIQFKNPSAVSQWRTNKTVFELKQFPQEAGQDWLKSFMFRASEFFI